MSPESRGGLSRLTKRLLRTPDQIDSDALADESAAVGREHIGDLVPRQLARVRGEVRSVTLRPSEEVAALDAELFDGTEVLHLVWLGRRTIPGVVPGVKLEASGRVTRQRDVLTMFNPTYEIIAREGSHAG